MRLKIKQLEPLIKRVRIPTPCIGICSTSTIGCTHCTGCDRLYTDIISWNGMDNDNKIKALIRAHRHRELKAEGLVDDWVQYSHLPKEYNT